MQKLLTLSARDNANLLQHLKSGFKHTINWNNYQSKITTQLVNLRYLNYLLDPSFHGTFWLIVWKY